jgi:hypothetical protein
VSVRLYKKQLIFVVHTDEVFLEQEENHSLAEERSHVFMTAIPVIISGSALTLILVFLSADDGGFW